MIRRQALPSAIALFATAATAQSSHQATTPANPVPKSKSIILLEPYKTVASKGGTLEDFRLKALARIDPAHPLAGEPNLQTFSLFGREDLIAATSDDYQPTACPSAKGTGDVLDEIVQRARKTSVVIINESHERSEHRGFTTALLGPLRVEGYNALAMEALSNPEPDKPPKHYPSFIRDPSLAYLQDEDGYYLGEAGFGRLGRTAKRLGYSLVPYEAPPSDQDAKMSRSESIARREEAQATTLATWISAHPSDKIDRPCWVSSRDRGAHRWMATRLKAKTGIDPITVSQTTCRGGGTVRRLAVLPTEEPAGTFDFVIDHPAARFVRGRPAWRIAAGDMPITIPAKLRQTSGWRVIEARPDGEPTTSVPMDWVAIRSGEDVALMLPPGRYRLRVVDVLREAKREAQATASARKIP